MDTAMSLKDRSRFPVAYYQMMRADFLSLLFSESRARFPLSADRRLARDLESLGGMAGAW
jgi:hypothetical protein